MKKVVFGCSLWVAFFLLIQFSFCENSAICGTHFHWTTDIKELPDDLAQSNVKRISSRVTGRGSPTINLIKGSGIQNNTPALNAFQLGAKIWAELLDTPITITYSKIDLILFSFDRNLNFFYRY